MRLCALATCVAAGLSLLVACGGGSGSAPDDPVGGTAAPSNPFGAAIKGGGQCTSDADCGSGFTCKAVSLGGELVQQSCVAISSDAGGAAPDASRATDAGLPKSDAAPGDAAQVDAGNTCSSSLVVLITSVTPHPRPKCYLNTTVDTSSPATLDYVCAGGAASVTFGAQSFTGTDAAGNVTLQHKSTYPISSPFLAGVTCKIDALQTITGDLASGTLKYQYSETFTPGQSSICPLAFELCFATGPVTVQ